MNADQEPRNPSGASNDPDPGTGDEGFGSRPDETALSDRLGAIADRHDPVPDWDDVVGRAGSPPVVALHGAGAGGRPGPFGRPMLAVAAALLLVVGGIGLVVATRGGDAESVDSGPAGPDDRPVIDTGWYIPTPLPDGWEVTSIEAATTTLVGPGTLAVWAHPDGSGALIYAAEPLGDGIARDGETIQLTEEIADTLLADEGTSAGRVMWERDDLLHLVIVIGVSTDDMGDTFREWMIDPTARTPPVEGMELVNWSERTYTELETTDVVVTFQTVGGAELVLRLSPPEGLGRQQMLGTIPVVRAVDGQPRDVLQLQDPAGSSSVMNRYLGIWPGADVSLSMLDPSALPDASQAPTEEDAMALIRSLRPATADQWRAFLRDTGLEVDERLLQAERLIDLSSEGTTEVVPTDEPPQPEGEEDSDPPEGTSDASEPGPGEAELPDQRSQDPDPDTETEGPEGPDEALWQTPFPCGGTTTELSNRYLTKTVAEAEAQAAADGLTLRVVSIDGVEQALTGDVRCDRVNVAVDGGRVVEVELG